VLKIFKHEMHKALHDRRTAWTVVGLSLFSFFLQLGFRFTGGNPLARMGRRLEIDPELLLNSINSTRLIMNATYYVILPVLAAMIFAGQFAGEKSSGTLWGILSRPVSRLSLYGAKFIVSSVTLLGVMLFFVGFTLIVGCVLFGTHDFLASPRIFDLMRGGGGGVLSFEEGVWRLFVSACLLSFLLLPTGMIAFWCGLFFKQTHTAMATALLVFFGCYVVQGLGDIDFLPLFQAIRPYLFTTAMESWIYVFYTETAWEEILPRAVVLLVYVVGLYIAGAIHLCYSDLGD